MKIIIISFAFLIAGISAIPQPTEKKYDIDFTDERLVSGSIENAINDLSQAIKDAGLDPLHIKSQSSSYALPVPVVFNYEAFVEDILSTGLSNIVIHRVSFSVITSRVNFDIELPLIHFSLGTGSVDSTIFSNKATVSAAGKVEIKSVRIQGQIRVSIGVISGVTLRSVDITFRLGDITSDVELFVLGEDVSDRFNEFVGKKVPDTIKSHNKEIDELLEILLFDIISANL